MLVIQLLVVLMRMRAQGLESTVPPLLSLVPFTIPSVVCGLLGAVGALEVATEIVIGEVCHFVAYGVLIPLHLAFHLETPPAEFIRWVMIALAVSTTMRAYLCHLKVHTNLSATSVVPHLLSLVPFYAAVFVRLLWDQGMSPDQNVTVRVCLFLHGFNVILHHHKAVDMEVLIMELRSISTDRALLLRAAFDATFYVRAVALKEKPLSYKKRGPLMQLLQKAGPQVAGHLEVLFSSPEMDALCCGPMASRKLTAQRVRSGLENVTEMVMRAAGSKGDPALLRTMMTLVDDEGKEFDCEVRAVPSRCDEAAVVVCGLRQIGEKRMTLLEEEGSKEEEKEENHNAGVASSEAAREKKASGSFGALVTAAWKDVWTALFADPPAQLDPPVCQAVCRALRCVEKLIWVQCELPSLDITEASLAAKAELPSPVIGRKVPTLLVSNSAAQTLRRALAGCSRTEPLRLAASGCICQSFGQVALWSTRGPSLPVVITFLILPAASSEAPPHLVLLFDRVSRGILRATTHSLQGSDVGPEDSASQVGLHTQRPRSLSWCDQLEERSYI